MPLYHPLASRSSLPRSFPAIRPAVSAARRSAALPDTLRAFEAWKTAREGEVPDVPFQILTAQDLGEKEWSAIANNASWQTTRMNLNTFARHSVFRDADLVKRLATRLADPEQVRRAKVFPYQLLVAFMNAGLEEPSELRNALQDAMETAISNVPEVTGKIVICPDVSGSMQSPITVVGTAAIRDHFDEACLQQAMNSRLAPGVTDLILNPDAHSGYGAPVGCVMVSPTHIYPGPVGVDIKCSISLLQLDIPEDAILDKQTRRTLINAIVERTPTGAGRGQRSVKKSRRVDRDLGGLAVTEGATARVCEALGIPPEWADRCEDSTHRGHDGSYDTLRSRLDFILESGRVKNFADKAGQLGSYGGGNHFGECEITRVIDRPSARETFDVFGLKDGHVSFLSHCGSRGLGNLLAQGQFKDLEKKFPDWSTPFPAGDKQLVYAPLGSPEANAYIDDMSIGANFATVNHLLINALVLEAFQEILPGANGQLVYFISHNIAREEIIGGKKAWVHRKGATRAIPGGHFSLAGTRFAASGHPFLLPGNPRDGSVVMVAEGGAERTALSLAMVTGQPFRMTNIRGKRQKPGLMRQHLTCVMAACEISDGTADGAEIGSTELVFRAGKPRAGAYQFAIGTAGSTSLLFQTLLPALLHADGPSTLRLEGGTHNPLAPPFEFIDRVFLPALRRMGAEAAVSLIQSGFAPIGGGIIECEIQPCLKLGGIDLHERGDLTSTRIRVPIRNLPLAIGERILTAALDRFPCSDATLETREPGPGRGVCCLCEAVFEKFLPLKFQIHDAGRGKRIIRVS